MTPDRRAEIRVMTRARWVPPSVVTELLAEVDRLESLVHSHQQEAHEWRRLAGERWEELDGLKATMARVRAIADALEAAIARPLDSPPANR